MTHFKALTEEKQKLKKAILNNQKIVDLLLNTGNNVQEFQTMKTGSKSAAANLVKTYPYVPGTEQDGRNYITMRGRVIYATSNHVKNVVLIVYVICNCAQIDLLQGSRADLIANEIDQILNNGEEPLFGLGGVKITTCEEVQFNDGYAGWELPYMTYERNRRPEIS